MTSSMNLKMCLMREHWVACQGNSIWQLKKEHNPRWPDQDAIQWLLWRSWRLRWRAWKRKDHKNRRARGLGVESSHVSENQRGYSAVYWSHKAQPSASKGKIHDAHHRGCPATLQGAKLFSVVEYWHVHLDDESSKLTTLNTPFGCYRFLRLPFGLKVSPGIFQRRLHQALASTD